jgi:hypothetical protein
MKQICSTRHLIRIALLLVSSAAGLMAQTEMASNTIPRETVPPAKLPSETVKGNIGTEQTNAAVNTFSGPLTFNPALSSRPSVTPGTLSVTPGTLAKNSTPDLKPIQKSAFTVEPDSLPSWETIQPLSYLRYGAAPAVVTLHFGHQ